MQNNFIQRFLRLESLGGILLFLMAALALVLSNSPLASAYQLFFSAPRYAQLGNIEIHQPLAFWINEGLMSLFFLLIGLELKRELTRGELSKPAQIVFPAVAALGGMMVPALIFVGFNWGDSLTLDGWAIPVATDIAFAVSVLSLFGKRVPLGLKMFLMALAIFDDVGAIVIIAIFHTARLSYLSLCIAVFLLFILFLFNRFNVRRVLPYFMVSFLLWLSVLHSGVHATLSGLALGLMLPGDRFSKLEKKLHPWVAYGVMPLFALANAGVSFAGLSFAIIFSPLVLGVALGLFIGKQLGVMIFSWLLVRLKWVRLPLHSSWFAMYGVALICGIGFTMSLFLGTLAFQGQEVPLVEMRLGVLVGSLMSGIAGAVILSFALRKENRPREIR